MAPGRALDAATPPRVIRAARFEDVPSALRLIEEAIEHGCRGHYDALQRRAVYVGYAASLFADAAGPHELWTAALDGRMAGVAQLDAIDGRLRGLFVSADFQGQGLGRALLAAIEARARAAGCVRLEGAMSLNAVPFYTRAGFRPSTGPDRLLTAGVRVPVVRMEKLLRG